MGISQQNTSKQNSTEDEENPIPWPNGMDARDAKTARHPRITVVHHTDNIKDENHVMISIEAETH